MKLNKILTFFCVLILSYCLIILTACKDTESSDFDVSSATSVITKLESEDDSFFNALTTKYQNDINYVKLTSFINAISELNTSIKTVISNFETYKSTFGSSEYADVFSYGEDFFKYQTETKLINVLFSKGTSVSVVTNDNSSICNIEIKMIENSHYAVRCFIKGSADEYGEEILYYFNGSVGRLRSRSCIETKSTSIFDCEDFSTFALDEGIGYYFFT